VELSNSVCPHTFCSLYAQPDVLVIYHSNSITGEAGITAAQVDEIVSFAQDVFKVITRIIICVTTST
jgi:hypothetical protein